MGENEWGVVDSVSNGLAFVKIRGESEPRAKGMKLPKEMVIAPGDSVVVSNISGSYIVIQTY